MKKKNIIRLHESDLVKIVQRVIKEQEQQSKIIKKGNGDIRYSLGGTKFIWFTDSIRFVDSAQSAAAYSANRAVGDTGNDTGNFTARDFAKPVPANGNGFLEFLCSYCNQTGYPTYADMITMLKDPEAMKNKSLSAMVNWLRQAGPKTIGAFAQNYYKSHSPEEYQEQYQSFLSGFINPYFGLQQQQPAQA